MEENENCGSQLIKDVMASIGWQNSFTPIIGEKSKKLLDGIRAMGNAKVDRINAVDFRQKEASKLVALLSSASNEFDQNLKLWTAHKSQFTTETHLYKLAEHDESSYRQSLKEAQKNHKELITQRNDFTRKFR